MGTLAAIVLGGLLALPAAAGAGAQGLPEPVLARLTQHRIPAASLSVFVQDVAQTEPLLSYRADEPRNPASVMKLVTTLVALQELGPGYRFQTEIHADGPLRDGVLEGNLYLVGRGDPFLVTESFWRMLKDLRQMGLEHIRGDLVIDGSYFRTPPLDPAAFDGSPHRAYNVGPHAALVNFHATNFRFYPDPQQGRVRVVADPEQSTLVIDNDMALVQGPCDERKRRVELRVSGARTGSRVRLSGTFPAGCGSYELLRAVSEPLPYTFGVFDVLWREMGGRLDGGGREATVPAGAWRLHRHQSRALPELIAYMNKYSNNVMTRNLLLALGAEREGPPGTLEKGQRVVQDWFARNGIDAPELVIDNGSGLSREERISARTLGRMLLAAWNHPLMPEFWSSLPLAAVDGTMHRRFRGDSLAGRAHLKTGLLNGVRAIAGYVVTDSGRRLVVVALHNHAGVQDGIGTEVQDALLRWLYPQ